MQCLISQPIGTLISQCVAQNADVRPVFGADSRMVVWQLISTSAARRKLM